MPEILKILIAVACILALVYLGVSLFGITTQDTEIEQARASLEQIVRVIDYLEDGEEKNHIMETRSGESWLVYFGDNPNNKLLCICLESNFREECVDEALGVCEQTEYIFEMLTDGEDTNIQYIKLNDLLVDVEINKSGNIINIVKSLVKVEGVWGEFSDSKPEEACPFFINEIEEDLYKIYTEAYEVSEFNSIGEIIIDLPNYWKEVKETKDWFFGQRTNGFLDECAREFQQGNEKFGMWIIFPEEDGQIPPSFVFHPISPGTPLFQWEKEDYWETTLTLEDGKKIIIKIYPEELFE